MNMMFLLVVAALGLGFDWHDQSAWKIRNRNHDKARKNNEFHQPTPVMDSTTQRAFRNKAIQSAMQDHPLGLGRT
jgi:hypothetical protein